jgi:polysaccharide export outer membrane protein
MRPPSAPRARPSLRSPGAGTILAAAIAAVLLSGCRAAEERRIYRYLNTEGFGKRAQGDANTENYVGVGDTVTITDTLHPTLQLPPQEVDVDGTIVVPDLGSLAVLGRTRGEIEALLRERFADLYDRTDLHVQIRSDRKKIFVVGEVKKPGAMPFQGDLTIFEVVLDAVPIDESANLGRVQLIRGDPVDPTIITVNFDDFIDYGDTTYNVLVRENDIVYVPPTFIGSFANLVKRLVYPVQVIVQPLQSLLFFLFVPRGGGRVF